jgi:hypothetical protein
MNIGKTIHLGAFVRTLAAPLILWVVAVGAITAAGQPGVVCVTPMAWLMALWCGGQYVRLSSGRAGQRSLLGAALVGTALGLGMGVVFILVSTLAMPVGPDPTEISKMQVLTAVISVGSVLVCAAFSALTGWLTLQRYTDRK